MKESYLKIPLTVTIILFLAISTAIVYIFDIIGHPIWESPRLIPLILIIPVLLAGWFPAGFYGIYLNRKKSSAGNILIVISILWLIAILVIIGCSVKSIVTIVSEQLGF